MTRFQEKTITADQIWFGLLALYIIMSYFAQDVLLPSILGSITLYVLLIISSIFILCRGKIKISSVIIWEVIFLFLSFVSTIYSPEFLNFGGTFYSLIVNLVLVFIFTQMPWTTERFRFILSVYVVSSVVLMIALALTGNLEDTSETGRLGQELMGNANILAMMLMVSAIYAIYLAVTANRVMTRVLSILGIVVLYIGMFLSGGRKYIVIPLIFLYVLLLIKGDAKGKKHFIRNTVIIAVIAYLVYTIMNSNLFYESIGQRFEGFFALFNKDYEMDSSTIKRQLMIEAGWRGWFENPLFGHGFDSFKYFNQQSVTRYFYYSHNNFIELLYNQGLVGFIGYYSFYAYLIVQTLKEKMSNAHKGFILGTVCALLAFEYAGITYSVTPSHTLLFLCCYLLNSSKNAQQQA